jgi:hypothetical protein
MASVTAFSGLQDAFELGIGCERNDVMAKQGYISAVDFEYVPAMIRCGWLTPESESATMDLLGDSSSKRVQS